VIRFLGKLTDKVLYKNILESKHVYEGEVTSSLVIDTTTTDKLQAAETLSKYILDQYENNL
jgi:hypothetical protein